MIKLEKHEGAVTKNWKILTFLQIVWLAILLIALQSCALNSIIIIGSPTNSELKEAHYKSYVFQSFLTLLNRSSISDTQIVRGLLFNEESNAAPILENIFCIYKSDFEGQINAKVGKQMEKNTIVFVRQKASLVHIVYCCIKKF